MYEYIIAFLVGGIICVIGQLFIDRTKLTPARILVGYVVGGVILSGFGLYQKLVDFAGCGATVVLSGFGHLMATGTKKAVLENGLIGVLTGPLTAAAAGITTAIVSVIFASLIFKAKEKA